MVLDFADEATEDIFHGNRSKAARRFLPERSDARDVQIVDYH